MSDLTPDERLAKLRALEEWLAWQLGDTRRKIEHVQQQVARQADYLVEKEVAKGHPLGATIHTVDCTMTSRETRTIDADTARKVLQEDARFFTACEFCNPAAPLGI
ncbi:DUF6233 domain-containing protein [Streptomyces sp. NPDC101249]|uniref:DUF6233 domain-containing protein n=1 Tax=Streptomyces sp. NPDC101249 TaxID=3366140 RepID=UPI00380E4218